MKSIVLVDGSFYLYRAFHALPPLATKDGRPVGAVRGVITMLNKLIAEFPTERFIVVFDAKGPSFRSSLYPAYKKNRPEMPSDLAEQIQPLYRIIKALGFPLVSILGVEADDVIGTLAKFAESEGDQVVISTGDKDLAQLVSEKVSLINTMTNKWSDPLAVRERFGVYPKQIAEWLALTGDTVDNIPGIPKCGPKTASKWLNDYGSLEAIIAAAANIRGKVGESLRENLGQLPVSLQLTTIRCDVDLPLDTFSLKRSNPDVEVLQEIYTELEMSVFLRDLDVRYIKSSSTLIQNYEIILDINQLDRWIHDCEMAKVFALDTETTNIVARRADLVGISLAISDGLACYIPIAHKGQDQIQREFVIKKIQQLLSNKSLKMVCHNLKYDLTVIERAGLIVECSLEDTMLMSYVIDASSHRHDLDSLALSFLKHKTVSFEEICGKGAKQISFDSTLIVDAGHYAAEDADITLRLFNIFSKKMKSDTKLLNIYKKIEIPIVHVLRGMENYGAIIDAKILAGQSVALKERLLKLQAEAFKLAGAEFNLASPKQLQEILFQKLNLPIIKKTPKGAPSTSEEVLNELAVSYELPKIIIEYRSLAKLKGTYTDRLPKQVDLVDNRVHTSFHQAVTTTGRLSSSDPNLQNIPMRSEEGRKIRRAFIAPDGWLIVAADYSQIELRIMAHLSGDSRLVEAFSNNQDIHKATAAEIFSVGLNEVSFEQRRQAKAVNFGLIYGMSAFGLSRQLGIGRGQAVKIMDKYFNQYPEVQNYMQKTRDLAHQNGFVETVFGRRLFLPEINSRQPSIRQAAERAAINAPMQGTAADIIKIAMLKINEWQPDRRNECRMILQVHDELVFEVVSGMLSEMTCLIKNSMEQAANLEVPLVVEIGSGLDWFSAH